MENMLAATRKHRAITVASVSDRAVGSFRFTCLRWDALVFERLVLCSAVGQLSCCVICCGWGMTSCT